MMNQIGFGIIKDVYDITLIVFYLGKFEKYKKNATDRISAVPFTRSTPPRDFFDE